MGRIAAIGEPTSVAGFALVGTVVVTATDCDAVRSAWDSLADDIDVVILTASAARALGSDRIAESRPLSVVMPS
jgi:vacuolar-type H+-ATPase subunit F/Vma7